LKEYKEEDYLMLSGIQHFLFCRRQWALIHIENQWEENVRTVQGDIVHKRAHDAGIRERRGDILTIRGLRIQSASLGVSGECDVVEFRKDEAGTVLHGEEGKWKPYPVEYKRGTVKEGPYDEAQLCGQAMCLEEMLCCDIDKGALFYAENQRRHEVLFTDELRETVRSAIARMHQIYDRGVTPKVKPTKGCYACSLKNKCLPELMKEQSALEYMRRSLRGDED
jgi:CRISPR-associated exonuclease Cas4